ncbi:High affinity cAMP-specific and IBMX-insensitive 3',5'-cyclic phosphodiesterase 9A [Apophysomyces ossiformis]|uniref:Phosphodiesterase n=1 Tax=Apophysomyces ossiformis TaxID=679940 RepID=A0A8H7BI16_9FUNG|nr:High affinity cAMP-specific and IBMX-insensitive 3',5'-cyclic phosphodiesterase 9A [Apophysomyces ossiformis]
MLILKHNSLSVQDLFTIERQLVRWLDNKGRRISPELNVLDLSRTDVYGHLLGLFADLNVYDTLRTTPSQVLDFLIDVDAAYLDAPYHSFYHAADIVIMLYYLLYEMGAMRYLSDLDVATLLLAALCHDVGHPGYNNLYQVHFKTALALRYNNTSVLESYSVDITRDLLQKHRLLKNVNEREITGTLESFILSTDMIYHYELQEMVGSLESTLADCTWLDSGSDTESLVFSEPFSPTPTSTHDGFAEEETMNELLLDQQDRHSLCRILLHAADISNTVRPWPISKQWSDLIVQEFFRQGDAEKSAGLPVSPGMDQDETDQPTISLKFGDFLVKPYFEALAALLPPVRSFLDTLAENRNEWQQLKKCPADMALTPPPPAYERYLPTIILPPRPAPNPTNRRISIPPGMVMIPDKRRLMGYRSASHPAAMPVLATPPDVTVDPAFGRRKSEQPYAIVLGSFDTVSMVHSHH